MKGKKYFISYGDSCYSDSLERIGREAESLGIFDRVVLYTDESLPEPFRTYARTFRRGGGYWLWKPWAVWYTLQQMDEGDTLVYADAGCTLLPHSDWEVYFRKLSGREALFFVAEGKSGKWCKQSVFRRFTPKCALWKRARQIQATCFLIRKENGNPIVRRWYEAALHEPDLFTDVSPEARSAEAKRFKEHRHDQSVLTACVCLSPHSAYRLMPEKMEKVYAGGQALIASRISATGARGRNRDSAAEGWLVGWINLRVIKPVQIFGTRLLFFLTRLFNG